MSDPSVKSKSLGGFFVDRPVFAISLSLAILIMGLVAMFRLPVSLYPNVVPPTVTIQASYPGASAETIARTVATPIEQEVNGVDGMIFMSSQSTNDGGMRITVAFEIGTDIDMAQVLVQNRVALAEPRLPEEVRRTGVLVQKNSPDFLMVVQLLSPDLSRDQLFLSNYASQNIRDRLVRLPGVGSVNIFGQRDYTMRVWLDPDRIANVNLTVDEVIAAIREQNTQVAGGQLAQPPIANDRAFQPTISLQGRLDNIEEFSKIIVKRGSDGQIVYLDDIARIELGAQDYSTNAYLNGEPLVAMLLFQQPGTNAIATSNEVKALMSDLEESFPSGVEYSMTYNPTDFFVQEAIEELVATIFEALVLVVLVVLVFLQNPRAAVIPMLAIPVSLIGTFLAMSALGYSINLLTLFGLVLAVGIVVDDAIIVVENVEQNINKGMSALEAARLTMSQVTIALIAVSLVLVSVFIPTILVEGFTGPFFREFGITIAVATLISLFNSLTLTPALAGLLLKSHQDQTPSTTLLGRWSTSFADRFNRGFEQFSGRYASLTRALIGRRYLMLTIYAGLIAAAAYVSVVIPKGFVPDSDQGYVIVAAQLPAGSSLTRADAMAKAIEAAALDVPGVSYAHTFSGFSAITGTNNSASATVFVQFEPYEKRLEEGNNLASITANLQAKLADITEANANVLAPPTVIGIGAAGGFSLRLQDYQDQGPLALAEAAQTFIGAMFAHPDLAFAFTPYNAETPELFFDLDRNMARQLNVPVSSVFNTLEVYLGSVYVNDFSLLGRTYQVRAQADSQFRLDPSQVANLRTRSESGQMVPLGTLGTLENSVAPDRLPRYNLFPTAEIYGQANSTLSSDQAMQLVQEIADDVLPPGFGIEWADLSYQQQVTEGSALLFVLGAVFAFLVLASQYESWSLPFAIILIVPMTLLSAMGGLMIMGMDSDIFSQIGLVVLIGLAAKNAILIVEFARQHEEQGNNAIEAAIAAAQERLRPILMTSIAFIMGVVPLMTATGAGAELRNALGTSVFWGMLGVTVFSLLFTPVFYVVMRNLADRLSNQSSSDKPQSIENKAA